MKYRLGSRKSDLALTQSRFVQSELKKVGVETEIILVESEGDQNLAKPLYEIEPASPGLFTKQLETALLNNTIDLAVHSLKDLPTVQPPGLMVAAVTARAKTADCLLIHPESFEGGEPLHLKKGARVGTSSLRREAQLLSMRSDLEVVPLRGNVPTRVQSVRARKMDAIVLACAGIERLSLPLSDLRRFDLDEAVFVPAPAQGALAIETRESVDSSLLLGIRTLHSQNAEIETRIERKVLQGLFGGCTLPLGVRCYFDGKNLKAHAFLGVARDRDEQKHEWTHFHRFDFSDTVEEALIQKAVGAFRGYVV